MKRRITKTKLLKHLTKQLRAAHKDWYGAPAWKEKQKIAWAKYETLLKVRDYINCHRI